VLASAGGVGKSSLVTVEAIAIATGRDLLGVKVKQRSNVWLVNLEDPVDEMHMRTLAAMKHYSIKPDDLRGRLFIDGEDTFRMTLAAESRDGILTNDALLDMMIAKVRERDIGVIIFDPFVSTHNVNENSNSSVQQVVAMMRKLARDTAASILLVHHVRKGNGDDASIDSVRGAGSLIGAARAARIINKVTEEDALKLGVDTAEARGIFRVDEGKTNLAPPAHAAVYRRMISVEIANGEWIGVCTAFALPDAFDGISAKDARAVQDEVEKAITIGKPYRDNPQSDEWIGNKIAEMFDIQMGDKSGKVRVNTILREWKKSGVLAVEKARSDRQGREVPIIVVGERVTLDDLSL
jgi:RecA-family ATPase